MGLNTNALLLGNLVLGKLAENTANRVIDIALSIVAFWDVVFNSIFPFKVGGIFDDSRPTTYDLDTEYNTGFRLFSDIPITVQGDYDWSYYFEPGQTHIDGASVGRNTFLTIIGIMAALLIARISGQNAKLIIGTIIGRFTGLKSRLNDIEAKVDMILDMPQAREFMERTNTSDDTTLTDTLQHIINMLGDGDSELTGLIKALANDDIHRLTHIDWGKDSFNPGTV